MANSATGITGFQQEISGNITTSASETFTVATATPWLWDANFTLTNYNASTTPLYQFELMDNSNNVLASDASNTLNGTDRELSGTLQPGTYTMTFELTDAQAYGYNQSGSTNSTLDGSAVLYVPEPSSLLVGCVGAALVLGRTRRSVC